MGGLDIFSTLALANAVNKRRPDSKPFYVSVDANARADIPQPLPLQTKEKEKEKRKEEKKGKKEGKKSPWIQIASHVKATDEIYSAKERKG